MDKKTVIPGLFRSEEGALINKDHESLAAYKKAKERNRKVKTMEERLNNIEERLRILEQNAR